MPQEKELLNPRQDHFALLGLKPAPRIDMDDLEMRYLRASRRVHPDLNRDQDEAELIEASSRLNEAWQTLKDPWKRLPYLADLYSPCILEETKNMAPCFLMEAMELGEKVEEAHAHPELAETLENELHTKLDKLQKRIEDLLLDPKQAGEAARLCHEARYVQRALTNLRSPD